MADNKLTAKRAKTNFLNFSKKLAERQKIFKLFKPKPAGDGNASANIDAQKQIEIDKKLVLSLAKSRIPTGKQLKYVGKYLSREEIWLIRLFGLIIIVSAVFAGVRFYTKHLVTVPISGGEYIEGLIGAPKYLNPLYSSVSDVDNDLTGLIYSSLFKRGKSGELVKDLIESYDLSPDNKTYTFTIRRNVKWQDGETLTIDDVIFTINSLKDDQYKSPLRLSFTGVTAEKIDENKFKLILASPYAPFLDFLTFGILPSSLWSQIPPESASLAELNIKPIGTGPYMFNNLIKDKSGNIKEYDLKVNPDYYGTKPYLDLKFRFYPDFESAVQALNSSEINAISYLPPDLASSISTPANFNYNKLYLPQLTALFINQGNNPALADKAVRQALAYAIDRNTIINQILGGDAYSVYGPILPNSFAYNPNIKKYDYNTDTAGKLLDGLDWQWSEIKQSDLDQANSDLKSAEEIIKKQAAAIIKMGLGKWRKKNGAFLQVTLTTVERTENQLVVEEIKKDWAKIGIHTDLSILPASDMQTNVIKPRNFEILFYGQVVGADPDLYSFWHSSQVQENGLNLANYSNKEVDQLLEDARLTSDLKTRQEKYQRFQEILAEELPAIFLYSPTYTYVQSKNVKGFDVKNIYLPSDRFVNVSDWYVKVGRKIVW